MKTRSTLQYFVSDVLLAISGYFRAIFFIQKHQLWKGLLHSGWIIRLLLFISLLIGFQFLYLFWQRLIHLDPQNSTVLSMQMGLFLVDFFQSTYAFLFLGGFKYIILILMDAIMEHFSQNANAILHNKSLPNNMTNYVITKWRIIRVVIRNFFREILATLAITIVLSLLNMDFFENFMIFIAHCYYVGFTLLDTHNSHQKMTIKQSASYTQQFVGVAVGIGVIFHFLLFLPLFGAIIAPCLGAVATTLTMYKLKNTSIVP